MALFHGVIHSQALYKDSTLSMIVPADDKKKLGFTADPKLLILLHGAGGTDYTWTRYTSLERYAESCNLIVLMPNIDFSFAMNMANGLPYQTYLAQELPALARQMFHVDFPRENIAVAGQSMGGFGALHTALSAPETFGACGVFSAPLYLEEFLNGTRPIAGSPDFAALGQIWKNSILGENATDPTPVSASALLDGADLTGHPLRVFHACGDMDFLTPDNRRFSPKLARKPGVTYEYHEYPGGHSYDVWDPCIRDFVQWFMSTGETK